jgi:hypothetical protein
MQRAYMRRVAESGFKPTDRLVAAAIATFADEDGVCWPSDRALAEITGLAERSHAAPRRRLIAAGLLERDTYGHGRTNRYRLILDPPVQATADDSLDDPIAVDNHPTARQAQRGVVSSTARQAQRGVDEMRADDSRQPARGLRASQRDDCAPSSARLRRDREASTRRDIRDVTVAESSSDDETIPVPFSEGIDALRAALNPESSTTLEIPDIILDTFPGITLDAPCPICEHPAPCRDNACSHQQAEGLVPK